MNTDMKECPKCGCEMLYIKFTFSGKGMYFHRFDGEETENGSMYEGAQHTEGKYAYCADCDKRLFKVKED